MFKKVVIVSGLEGGPGVGPGGEDLITLEAEITELQRENARVESQMLKLRTDITAMEAHLRHGDKVSIHKNSQVLFDFKTHFFKESFQHTSPICAKQWSSVDYLPLHILKLLCFILLVI